MSGDYTYIKLEDIITWFIYLPIQAQKRNGIAIISFHLLFRVCTGFSSVS